MPDLSVLEHLAHRFASQVRANGILCLSANGDPALVKLFAALGWADPHPIESAPVLEAVAEVAATLRAPERAVLKAPKGRIG